MLAIIVMVVSSIVAGYKFLRTETGVGLNEATLQQEIANMQPLLPLKIDDYTQLTRAEAQGMAIYYEYTVLNQLNMNSNDSFTQNLERYVKDSACRQRELKKYINNNISLHYKYRYESGRVVAEFVIPSGYCKR